MSNENSNTPNALNALDLISRQAVWNEACAVHISDWNRKIYEGVVSVLSQSCEIH